MLLGIPHDQAKTVVLAGISAVGSVFGKPGRDLINPQCNCTTPQQMGPKKDFSGDNSSQLKCIGGLMPTYDLEGLLRAVFPKISDETLRNIIWPMYLHFAQYGFDTPARIAAFIAQSRVETGPGLAWLAEGDQVFEPGSQEEQDYYNQAYKGVNGNGDADSGDGFNYRGHGVLQITGRTLYSMLGQALSPLYEKGAINPDTFMMGPDGYNGPGFLSVNDPFHMAVSLRSGIWYYTDGFAGDAERGPQYVNAGNTNGNYLADQIQSDDDWDHFDQISQMVNGGNSGLQDRRDAFKTAYDYLSNKDHGCS